MRLLTFRQAAGDLNLSRITSSPGSKPISVRAGEPALQLWPLHCRAVLAGATDDEADHLQAVKEYRALPLVVREQRYARRYVDVDPLDESVRPVWRMVGARRAARSTTPLLGDCGERRHHVRSLTSLCHMGVRL